MSDRADRLPPGGEPTEPVEPPVEPATAGAPTAVDLLEEGAPAAAPESAVVRRGDRFPPNLFVVAVPGVVVFPDLTMPVQLRAAWAERTVLQAASQSEFLGLAVHRAAEPDGEAPTPEQLHDYGCLVRILRSLQMPDGTRTLLVQGVRRFKIERFLRHEPYLIAKVAYPDEVAARGDTAEALSRNVRKQLRELVDASAANGESAQEIGVAVLNIERFGALADFAAAYVLKAHDVRAELLATLDVEKRLLRVSEELTRELQILTLGNKIQDEIRKKIEKRQQEFFLREQLKAIRKELGEERDERGVEVDDFRKRMEGRKLPPAAKERAEEDLRRLATLSSDSPEAAVLRGYLDWLLALPFGSETQDQHDLVAARRVLDRDHFGLDEVKDRILEFLAVRARVPDHKGQILCLLGPPGVGKTSLGRSIASALGRKFVRISLGGVRDEAEIRGHRRTYVGAQPGRIVRAMRTAGSMNPVFMLDELDKLGADFRGDPGAALLEALDPEQNGTFSDHYLEVPLDLSRVFFIATANDLEPVPAALRDRLDVIELAGYVTEEKVAIASRFLLKKQRKEHGLAPEELKLGKKELAAIALGWTREAGVRALDARLARIARKVVRELQERPPAAAGKKGAPGASQGGVSLAVADLPRYLGPPRYLHERLQQSRPPGVAMGLAWTPVGGEVLEIQAMAIPQARKGLELTGMLGDVMQESARIAIAYVLAHAKELALTTTLGKEDGLHLHVPAGAVRKDGPSAGVTMTTALVSLLRGEPVRSDLAMTGEITLTGQVLAVGGIRDKLLAARRAGLRRLILPADNEKDVDEVRPDLKRGLRFHFVRTYGEVVPLAFERRPIGRTRRSAGRGLGSER
ncbi:MAG: endopeptidase La [Planctomycetes bacterium]|nr:endopeptidase La [Planctomycetota bacterium]